MKSKNTKTYFKGWTLAEMPKEVVEALVIMQLKYVGRAMIEKLDATIAKYPEFFKEKETNTKRK